MKKYNIASALFILAIVAAFTQSPLFAQTDEMSYINEVAKKKIVTVSDALNLYELIIDKKPFTGRGDPKNNVNLRKGFISYIVANNLRLNDSLLYRIFNSHRYAFRVCVAHELLNADGSENDYMSGEELIEFLRLASEYKDKGVSK